MTTYSQQIKAIMYAKSFFESKNRKELASCLNDAGSTIAALNLTKDLPFDAEKAERECRADLKEIAHFFGGWDELRKVIDGLQDNDNEAAYERAMTNY